ncbi:(d)CMP kinase [Peribacillus cavernae]|uniref:Cytidylate kinase n=1 Tax=Peribacillus cavernae TaxID=1674310 RepID=A0A433HLN6_9BACI|nr:(d)CMP kinase [Peribacillus cavernae]MDQ0219006.1 cytidylate kinase [Peribacillus cavernae]RUQ29288.1 (d)CMP kinase [Peribacillus cavernae]
MEKKISVAIDGPAAAGKSTVAKIVAGTLNYIYVDTGAMYRALTYKSLSEGVDIGNEIALVHLLNDTVIELKPNDYGQLVFLDNQNVTEEIRNNEVTASVSEVSKHKSIREEMVRRQQLLAKHGGIVMDGRDIGTHVLPAAEVKVFLIASVEERALRRHQENIQKGFSSNLGKLKEEISLRDKLDSEREVAPLRKAHDAIEIDTTSLSVQQVAEKIMSWIEERTR